MIILLRGEHREVCGISRPHCLGTTARILPKDEDGPLLDRVQRNAAVRPVAIKTKNQLHVFQSAAKAGVDGVQEIRKIARRLGPLDPASGGTKELVERDMAH
jgi:hypothetical protein